MQSKRVLVYRHGYKKEFSVSELRAGGYVEHMEHEVWAADSFGDVGTINFNKWNLSYLQERVPYLTLEFPLAYSKTGSILSWR